MHQKGLHLEWRLLRVVNLSWHSILLLRLKNMDKKIERVGKKIKECEQSDITHALEEIIGDENV